MSCCCPCRWNSASLQVAAEIIGDKAAADVSDGAMRFEVTTPCDKTRAVLEGLRLHLGELSAEYGSNIVIIGGAD